jgi:hypothetical protein
MNLTEWAAKLPCPLVSLRGQKKIEIKKIGLLASVNILKENEKIEKQDDCKYRGC